MHGVTANVDVCVECRPPLPARSTRPVGPRVPGGNGYISPRSFFHSSLLLYLLQSGPEGTDARSGRVDSAGSLVLAEFSEWPKNGYDPARRRDSLGELP